MKGREGIANKVFIVEDDAVIARAVAAHLTTWQIDVYKRQGCADGLYVR